MDNIDKKILEELQKNSSIPLSELSKKVGLSNTPCWNRIKKLEEEKIIKSKSIIIDNKKINLPITVFLSISIQNHTEQWLKNFEKIQNLLNLKCLGSKFKIFVLGKIVNKFLFRIFNLEKQFFSQLFFRLVQNFFLRLNSTINSLPLKKLHEIRFKYYICNEFRLNNFLFNGNKKKRLYP